MKTLTVAAAAAIFATATFAAPAQAGPFFHNHHHYGHWGHPGYLGVGPLVVGAGLGLAASDCYVVRRRVLVPGIGVVLRRETVCG